ncbi:CYTH and CHAD domain-containing protein [Arthrobacter castelli]|uniref:CYTH and CHAD domain-containing protein n=1 Tax=Arthrobacter castelli TaxID=271431 RepID=UPI00041C1C60|nr:CYTH and CHAD domain-containing protein [Arthrobacter castelli]
MADIEMQRSYTPPDEATRPDLTGLEGVARAMVAGDVELTEAYFDTPDSALPRAGVTLRRLAGGDDEGWRLHLPAGSAHDEVRLPLSRARKLPPKPMREAVTGWTRGTTLGAVATLTTRRTDLNLLDQHGTVLARFADADIEGVRLAEDATEPVCWSEWHFELVGGNPKLLAAADKLLAAAGGDGGNNGSEYESRLEHLLGVPMPPHPVLPQPKRRKPARLLVHARIAGQVTELGRRDSEIRRGKPEGVHKARLACRRLRGALGTFRPVLDREVTEPIRAELRWLAHALAEARDLDVAHDRLRGLADDVAPSLVMGPVRRRIERTHTPLRKAAHARAREALASERYFALREDLDRLAAEPPWTARAEDDARDVLPRCLRKDLKRLRKRVRRVRSSDDPAQRDSAIHAARRTAKRLRYAAETLQPVWGREAKAVAKPAKRMASILGVRQDALVTMPQLVGLAKEADAAGESTFTYGLLHAEEQRRASDIENRFEELFSDVDHAARQTNF